MKICIIGGSGFIGKRVIDLLHSRFPILNMDKNPSAAYPDVTTLGDIRDQAKLDKALKGKDLVIHLAAEHRDDVSPVSLYYDVNVTSTQNVLNAMDKNSVHSIIFTSSVAIFGLNKINPDENHPADPFNDYGKSKWQAEEILRQWQQQSPKERNLSIVRPTVVFGENNRGNVYNLLEQISSGRFMMVGDGKNKKSMAYVGNVAAFVDYCAGHMEGYRLFNYVDKPDLDMNELVGQVAESLQISIPRVRFPKWLGMLGGYGFDALGKLTSKKFSVSSVRVKKFCAVTQFNSAKAHSCGFIAPFSLSEGLDRTLKREFAEKIKQQH
jgi:nucleoside-diphosphate-sugar epimerase